MSERFSALAPRQWYRIENASVEAAEVYIYDEISIFGVTAKDFVGEIAGLKQPSINLHLNTPGGDVFDGIAIFNALKNHPADVNAYIEGLAASIGTVIAMAADNIVIAPHARMMIHEAWGMALGNAEDMAKMAERLEATSQNIASIYAERAGGSVESWRDLMRAETWYSDKEAVDAGLATSVGRANDAALKQAAAFDLSTFRYGEREAAMLRAEADVPASTLGTLTFTTGDSANSSSFVIHGVSAVIESPPPPDDDDAPDEPEPEDEPADDEDEGSPPEENALTYRERLRMANDEIIAAAEAALERDAARAAALRS